MPEEIVPTEESPKEEIPTSVEEKKEKRWLRPLLFSILGIILAVGLVFAGYKFGQKQVQPGPQPTPTSVAVATPTPDPTTDWETYTNTKYGYLIKYPPDWEIGIEIASFTKDGYSLTIAPAPGELSQPPDITITTSNVKIGDRDYLKSSWEFPDGRIDFERINLETEDNLEIVLGYKDSIYSEEYEQIFNLMLSTFKFLEDAAEGQSCGGIIGKPCPAGYRCKYVCPDNMNEIACSLMPDAGGYCVKIKEKE